MKRAVHFGAGNIGRGFLGQLYFESGFGVTFVDVAEPVVAALQHWKGYPILLVDEHTREVEVSGVDAVHASDVAAVAECLAGAEVASTAVGVNALPHVAPVLAAGIARRMDSPGAGPLNIIVCENMLDAAAALRAHVIEALPPEKRGALDTWVGFVNASVGRMAPVMPPPGPGEHPLRVCVEPYCTLPVDKAAFRGAIPQVAHMAPRDNFAGYLARKLFLHNMSHAAAAYLGHARGHAFICDAAADPAVHEVVVGALEESCAALHKAYGLDHQALVEHGRDLVRRYKNRALGDQVGRVARDPLRKLGGSDRLCGAALLCERHGIAPRCIAMAAAAALHYDDEHDPRAQELQARLSRDGLSNVLETVCELPAGGSAACLVEEEYNRFPPESWRR